MSEREAGRREALEWVIALAKKWGESAEVHAEREMRSYMSGNFKGSAMAYGFIVSQAEARLADWDAVKGIDRGEDEPAALKRENHP